MDFFKNIYNKYINNIFFMYPSLIYFNFINKYGLLKNIFNMYFLYYLYKNKDYYINIAIDTLIVLKVKICNLFRKNNSFILQKVKLYSNLRKNYDVTNYFYKNKIHEINRLTIINIYSFFNINFNNNEDIRLKIYFKYNNINYIIYFPYHKSKLYDDINENNNDYYIPYPPYSIDIINNFRNDIIIPLYTINLKKKYLYSLFNIESKDILSIQINNMNEHMNEHILKYFEMIKTPFNDYGILYNIPVKLIWIIAENYIDIYNFDSFYLKFESMYINEETFELNEHFIQMNNHDLFKYIISDRMKEIIILKIKEDNKKKISFNNI